MKKHLTTLLLSMLAALTAIAQTPLNRIDSVMQLAYQRGIFNGNILISHKGSVIYQRGFGFADGSKKQELNPNLKFDIGSVSKEFNGAAIMILKEQGKLTLDDALSKYFSEFPAWAQQVKVKQLLNYTSGIPMLKTANGDNDYGMYTALKTLPALAFAPGTGYIYNHANVYLQMRIVEKASQMKYADFITKYIFKPAGMRQTQVDYPIASADMAHAFDNEGNTTAYGDNITGWVRLTAGDLYKWTEALHNNKIISQASLRELAANFPGGESSLGSTGHQDDKLVWHQHQGSNANYEATIYSHIPEQITIVMLTNNQQMKVLPLKSAITNALTGMPVIVPKKSVYLEVRGKMLANIDSGIARYNYLKAHRQDVYDFSFEIGDLISAGKYIQRRNRFDDAIRIFNMAAALSAKPADLSYAYELMAQCYQSKGNTQEAVICYRKAVEISPGNKNAEGMIMQLQTAVSK